MIPLSALLVAQALEDASMPLKPRIKVKAKGVSIDDYEGKGIPIGPYQVVVDAAGKATIKPKRKPRPLPQEIASRKKRRYKPAK